MKLGYLYIMTNQPNGPLYIGVTHDLAQRLTEHREGLIAGEDKSDGLNRLVHVEIYEDVTLALLREKVMTQWSDQWMTTMIEAFNPEWRDLFDDVVADHGGLVPVGA